MINQALSILLALHIVACPFICQGGGEYCAEPEAAAEEHCCHACCAKGSAAEHKPAPPAPSEGECRCKCMCTGAVVEQNSAHELDLDLTCWEFLPAKQCLASGSFAGCPARNCRALLPDDGENQGRAMRCLMMSYLC